MKLSEEDRALATALNKIQWVLVDACHDIPAGRYRAQEWGDLADLLENLTRLVRRRAERSTKPAVVIDSSRCAVQRAGLSLPSAPPSRSKGF